MSKELTRGEKWAKLQKYEKSVERLYKVNDVSRGFKYYVNYFLDLAMDLFMYNIPDGEAPNLPPSEIERRLLKYGFCSFFDHPKFGLIVCDSYPYNYDIYNKHRNVDFFNFFPGFYDGWNPSGKLLGKEAVIVYNNSIEGYLDEPYNSKNTFWQTVCRYARMMADLDATINITMVSNRAPKVLVAGNEQTQASMGKMYTEAEAGAKFIVLDKNIVKDATSLPFKDIVSGELTEYEEVRATIIKDFFLQLGVKVWDDKKERLLVDEVESEQNNASIFVLSMLKARRIGIAQVNKLFNTNITVGLNPLYYQDGGELDEN